MKKHLIAAAVAGALAVPAMAQVEIYGVIGAAYENTKLSIDQPGADDSFIKTTTTGANNRQAGNRVGFRGKEDLGGGMSASFVYELNTDIATGMGTVRRGFVALGGGFGEVRLGREDGAVRQVYNSFTAFGNSGFAPGNPGASAASMGAAGIAADLLGSDLGIQGCGVITLANLQGLDPTVTAADVAEASAICTDLSARFGYGGDRINGITYVSPAIGGLTLTAQVAQANVDNEFQVGKTKNDSMNLGIRYSAGPLQLALGYDDNKASTDGRDLDGDGIRSEETKNKTTIVGGSYDLSAAKVFLTHVDKRVNHELLDDRLKVKDSTIGVSVPLGSLELVGSYSDGSFKAGGDTTDMNAYMLIANYRLSKRTHAYAMFGETEYDSGTANVDNQTVKLKGYTIGVQHNF